MQGCLLTTCACINRQTCITSGVTHQTRTGQRQPTSMVPRCVHNSQLHAMGFSTVQPVDGQESPIQRKDFINLHTMKNPHRCHGKRIRNRTRTHSGHRKSHRVREPMQYALVVLRATVGLSSGRQTGHDLENISLGEDDTQGLDTLMYVHPSMDIFKANFMSDGEDSNDEVEEDGGSQEKKGEAPNTGPSTLPQRLEEKPMKDADPDADTVARAIPPPLRVHDVIGQQQHTSHEPRSAERPSAESVDMTTFKPVSFFAPSRRRQNVTRKTAEGRRRTTRRGPR